MAIPEEHKGRYFYHFTHIENLESIIKNGFLSTNQKESSGITHKDIAYESIQHRRSEMDVTCKPNGKVHDYVPFYFATTNPMLLSITNRKNIDQPFMIFFAIPISKIDEANVVFTDASANTNEPPIFYNKGEDLDKLDWDAVDRTKWGSANDEERHKRMAEVLVHNEMPLDWIESIIVWNDGFKEEAIKLFKENEKEVPNVTYSPFHWRHFYFTKFMFGEDDKTLVTGPFFLKSKLERIIKAVKKKRKKIEITDAPFENIQDAINKIKENFCVIPELEGIYELKTDNRIHNDTVSDHTKKVVTKLSEIEYYKELPEGDKQIVELSAYLHDIGKGPKSRWKDEVQRVYPDHPADGLSMLERVLSEDFKEISEYQIKKICLLVGYHDLIGDILEKDRSQQELVDLDIDVNELNMLISITLADVSTLNFIWEMSIRLKLRKFVKGIKKKIE